MLEMIDIGIEKAIAYRVPSGCLAVPSGSDHVKFMQLPSGSDHVKFMQFMDKLCI